MRAKEDSNRSWKESVNILEAASLASSVDRYGSDFGFNPTRCWAPLSQSRAGWHLCRKPLAGSEASEWYEPKSAAATSRFSTRRDNTPLPACLNLDGRHDRMSRIWSSQKRCHLSMLGEVRFTWWEGGKIIMSKGNRGDRKRCEMRQVRLTLAD